MSFWDKLKGVGSKIYHGAMGGGGPSYGGAPGGGPLDGWGGAPSGDVSSAGITDPYFKGFNPNVNAKATVGDPAPASGGGTLSKGWDWAKQHPEAIATAAGIGASIYEGRQAGQNADKEMAQNARQFEQTNALNARQVAVSEHELQARLEADQAEKDRRRAAILQILGMDRTPVQQPPAGG